MGFCPIAIVFISFVFVAVSTIRIDCDVRSAKYASCWASPVTGSADSARATAKERQKRWRSVGGALCIGIEVPSLVSSRRLFAAVRRTTEPAGRARMAQSLSRLAPAPPSHAQPNRRNGVAASIRSLAGRAFRAGAFARGRISGDAPPCGRAQRSRHAWRVGDNSCLDPAGNARRGTRNAE